MRDKYIRQNYFQMYKCYIISHNFFQQLQSGKAIL